MGSFGTLSFYHKTMAGKIDANQNNKVVLYATLPPDDTTNSIIIEMESHYDQMIYRDTIAVEQRGKWVVGELTADKVPPNDDFYDVDVYAGTSGNITWAGEERKWSEITETWGAISGIIKGILLANTIFEVDGNEDYSSKEYVSQNSDFNSKEYVSGSEDVSENEYISDNETPRSKSYK